MTILPAIDLLGGRCVRLARGSFDAVTVYDDDPAGRAAGFAAEGATSLHVVDLDGARRGHPVHLAEIAAIRRSFEGTLQVGGGLRDAEAIEGCFELGVDRVILGTAAIDRPDWLAGMVRRFGAERVLASIDLRGREVMVDGWVRSSDARLAPLLEQLTGAGVRSIVFTDTERDGLLGSADAVRTRDFVAAGFATTVAGGVAGTDDIRRLAAAGATGAIVGSALYEGRLDLAEALAVAAGACG